MISVVIPLYNKEDQVTQTLRSVLRQSFAEFEIIVVNDGSTDASVAAVASVKDARIRLVHQENAGVSAARNRGIAEAKYDLIAFLDADDEWHEDYLKAQYELMQRYPQCSVFACGYEFVRADGTHASAIIRKLPFDGEHGILSNYFEVASCSHPPICSISIMVRKAAIEAIGGFPIGIRSGEDLLTWARLVCRYEVAYSRRIRAWYHFVPAERNDEKDGAVLNSLEYVLLQLEALRVSVNDSEKQQHLSQYISFMYKMQAHAALFLGRRLIAAENALKAIRYFGMNWKAACLLLLSVCPRFILRKLLAV